MHDSLMSEYVPKVAKNFQDQEISPTFYASKWFMKLFLGIVPMDLVLRIWDIMFLEGEFNFFITS